MSTPGTYTQVPHSETGTGSRVGGKLVATGDPPTPQPALDVSSRWGAVVPREQLRFGHMGG